MSMTNEQIQALREQAECVCGILENIAGYEPDDIDGDDVELRFETEEGFDTGCNVSIVEQCQKSADVIRSLLAERDADKALIEVYSDAYKEAIHEEAVNWEAAASLAEENAEQAKRIAKLERALDLARNSNSVLAIRSELEARTLTVKLSLVSFFDFKTGSAFASGAYVNVEAMNKALAAAGITLVVGE
ncbi:hypothetical protein PO369_14620 [Phytobacter diazotrophicus]|uniref:hypothetical protein n=1 Tax=Phytobacter diazotrophicus TaxID=395631 RepID=UPI002FFADA2E